MELYFYFPYMPSWRGEGTLYLYHVIAGIGKDVLQLSIFDARVTNY